MISVLASAAPATANAAPEANEHMYWLSALPESVLCAPAPDDDDAANERRSSRTTSEETAANRKRIVEAAILRAADPSSLKEERKPRRGAAQVRNTGKPVVDLTGDDRQGA